MVEAPTTKAKREALREKLRSKLEQEPATRISSIDGLEMTSEQEGALNEALAMCFRGSRGKEALDYLARLTVERIAGPNIDPNALLHMEGGRYVYGVIKARVELGKERK